MSDVLKQKTIFGQVMDAKYYPSQKSIVVVMRDIESNKSVKPVQIHASSFSFKNADDVDVEMHKTAELMKKCKYPIRIVFQPTSMMEEKAWFGDEDAIKQVYGDQWLDYIKSIAHHG